MRNASLRWLSSASNSVPLTHVFLFTIRRGSWFYFMMMISWLLSSNSTTSFDSRVSSRRYLKSRTWGRWRRSLELTSPVTEKPECSAWINHTISTMFLNDLIWDQTNIVQQSFSWTAMHHYILQNQTIKEQINESINKALKVSCTLQFLLVQTFNSHSTG